MLKSVRCRNVVIDISVVFGLFGLLSFAFGFKTVQFGTFTIGDNEHKLSPTGDFGKLN